MSFVIPMPEHNASSALGAASPRLLTHLIKEKNWSRVSRRLSKSPLECNLWIKVGANDQQQQPLLSSSSVIDDNHKDKELALHLAIRSKAPSRVIQKMIMKHPRALRIRDGVCRRYPLHLACLHTPDYDVLKLMIEKFPQALSQQDILGRIPLHYAAFGGASLRAFDLLLNEYPQGPSVKENYGWLPFHVATKMACSFDIMTKLAEAYPRGVTSLTTKKSTPKRLARTLHGPKTQIEEIVDVLEATVLATEEEGVKDDEHFSFQRIAEALWMERQHRIGISTNMQRNQSLLSVVTDELDIEASEHGTIIVDDDGEENIGGVDEDVLVKNQKTTMQPKAGSSSSRHNTHKECVICMEATSTHVYAPCGHMCICEECLEMQEENDSKSCSSLSSNHKRCPVCRKQAFLVMKVFS